MILFKKFGDMGRDGNQLFQLAYVLALSKRSGVLWALPDWKYKDLFAVGDKWVYDDGINVDDTRKESGFDFDYSMLCVDANKNVDHTGYFQSELYFSDVWRQIGDMFYFKHDFLFPIIDQSGFEPSSKDWAVHVRRGDYVGNSNYIELTPRYYISFFKEHPNDNFYIFSDDYGYCRRMFKNVPNVEFVDKCSPIEHLALMSQFSNHFIANSSFSWWGAKLAELYNKNVNVVRPDGLFAGRLAVSYTGNNFYPPRWGIRPIFNINVKPTKNKMDLKNVTFVIPVKYDHTDRRENLDLCIAFLQHWFNTNIIVGEQGGAHFEYVKNRGCKYINFEDMLDFHRTKMLNHMVSVSETPIVFNWDADVLVPPQQIKEAVDMMVGDYYFVYPYDGRFIRAPRECIDVVLKNNMDVSSIFGMGDKKWYNRYNSVGGAVGFRVDKFWQCGGENEHFISHAPEDPERKIRYETIFGEDRVGRVDGVLYHIAHYKGPDSTHSNDFMVINNTAYRLTANKSKEELLAYINTWPWVAKYPKQIKTPTK